MCLKGRYKSHILIAILLCFILLGSNFLQAKYTFANPDGTKDFLEYKFEGEKLKLLDERNYGNYKSVRIDTWFDNCQIFDEENWSCSGSRSVVGGEKIKMNNGVITWEVGEYNEPKTYKKIHKFSF